MAYVENNPTVQGKGGRNQTRKLPQYSSSSAPCQAVHGDYEQTPDRRSKGQKVACPNTSWVQGVSQYRRIGTNPIDPAVTQHKNQKVNQVVFH